MPESVQLTQRPAPPTITPLPPHSQYRPSRLSILFVLVAILAFINYLTSTPLARPTIITSTCQQLIRYNDYRKYIPMQEDEQAMEPVQYIDQVVGGRPAALVQVIDTGSRHLLDFYIFGCTMQRPGYGEGQVRPVLTLLYKQQGLEQGTVNVTQAHTLSVSLLDPTLSPNTSIFMQPQQQRIYRELCWQHGTFVQVTFPGLYPVITRGEAEALQDQLNNGQAPPWNNPLFTAEQMAKDILRWSASDLHATLQDNNGLSAHILLTRQHPHIELTATLQRLLQPADSSPWFVTAAQSAGITLERTPSSTPVSSPLSIQGTVGLPNGRPVVQLFDHTFTPLPILNTPAITVNADGTYQATILYTSNAPCQPGLLLIEDMPAGKSTGVGQVLLTNLLLS